MLHKSQRKKNHRSCSRAHQGRFIGLLNNRFGGKRVQCAQCSGDFRLGGPRWGRPFPTIDPQC